MTMLYIAQRMPEEPWHLVLRSDEGGGLTAICGSASLSQGWWRRRSSPVTGETVPEGVCRDCYAAVREALDAGLVDVAETMARLEETLRSVQPSAADEPGREG